MSRLEQATELLQDAYGRVELPDATHSSWIRFVQLLLNVTDESKLDILKNSLLSLPATSAQATAGQLMEILAPIPRGPQKASVIRALANWWVTQFGEECSPEWSSGLQSYRESLRAIKGLGPATVDELLLFGASLTVFPVDRTALRVAVRHGWLDMPVEDEQAQCFFVHGHSVRRLQELSRLLTKVGEAHCGREPLCEGCPLKPLLPEGGPLNPQGC